MSGIAMSNETDLDWLARNVHEWQGAERCVSVCNGVIRWTVGSKPMDGLAWFTKHEWLSRRAELQNKPDWSKAEEWAEWLAQDSYGCWGFFQKKPLMHALSWIARSGYYQIHYPGNSLLGDWRDTLEKRPEQLKPSIEEANRLAQEFNPFTSIEDNQDREGVNQNLNELEMLGKVSHLISDKRHRITTSKYTKTIHGVPVDVYDVLQAWGVINPALQHLIKKALQCEQRGHKDNAQDLQDIIDSAIRAKELG